jgi:hypothetical protein
VVLVSIKKMYIRIPKNRILIIIIEYICANGIAILLVIIILRTIIIRGWFYLKIIGYKVLTISNSSYTNKGIYIKWLDDFIKQYNYSVISHWRILLINGATYYKAPNFIIKAKIHKI